MPKNIKKSWFQGAGEASFEGEVTSNDPSKLGYPKEIGYNKKPMEVPVGGDSRDWEQKWFEGAAAETKKVLGPSGAEFKMKQQMQRIPMDEKIANASLSGKFTVAKSPQNSYWTIYATDKKTGKKEKVLTASLDQIWGKELTEELAWQTRSNDYIKEVMSRIRNEGFSKVAYLVTGEKKFIKEAGIMGGIGGAIAGGMLGGPLGAAAGGMLGSQLGGGSKESKKDEMKMDEDELTLTVEDEADKTATRSDVTVEELEQKKDQLEQAESKLIDLLPAEAAELGKEVQALEEEVETAIEEHKMVAAKLRDKTISASAKVRLMKIADEAFEAAAGPEGTLASSDEAMSNLADRVEALAKEVDEKVEELKGSVGEEMQGGEEGEDMEAMSADEVSEGPAAEAEEGEEEGDKEKMELTSAQIKNFLAKRAEMEKAAMAEEEKYHVIPQGGTKDGHDEVHRAHPKGGFVVPDLTAGAPIKNEGALVETISEQQEKDMAVATKMPTGELNASAASKGLVRTAAAVDPATKNFWHELFDQMGPAGKKFASELTDTYTHTITAATEEIKGRVKRAYELAEVASTKGLVEPNLTAKAALADRIMKFDDEAFLAYKEAVENTPTKKVVASDMTRTASKLPVVGQNDRVIAGGDEFEKLSKLWG